MGARKLAIVGVCVVFAGGCPDRTFVPPDSDVLFSDDFSEATLEAGWELEGDPSDMSLTARSGFLRMLVPPGQQTQFSLLLREVTGNFVISARMEFDPAADRHVAGLSIEDADGKRLSFGLLQASGERGTFRGVVPLAEESADLDVDATTLAYEGTSIYLRIERTLDSFALAYSADGETYTLAGTVVTNLSDDVLVGVGAATSENCIAACEDIVPADFDFFEISRVE